MAADGDSAPSEVAPAGRRTAGPVAARLGLWSAASIVVLFAVFTLCFVGLAARGPLFRWSGVADYVTYATTRPQALAHLARAAMLAFGPLYLAVVVAIDDLAVPARRVWSRLALALAVPFATLTGAHYFVQLSAVRLAVERGEVTGLEQVVQANPLSALSAANMAGWTVFFGLSSAALAVLFAGGWLAAEWGEEAPTSAASAPAEGTAAGAGSRPAGSRPAGSPPAGSRPRGSRPSGSRLDRAIAAAFAANAACCLLGGWGYAVDNTPVVFVTINLGMGGAVIVACGLLALRLRAIGAAAASPPAGAAAG